MHDKKMTISIKSLQQNWQWQKALLLFLKIFVGIVLVFMVLKTLIDISAVWGILLFVVAFILAYFFQNSWRVSEKDVALFLNEHYVALEESAELLLMPIDDANVLEKIQQQKIQSVLNQLIIQPPFKKQWIRTLVRIIVLLLIGFVVLPLVDTHIGNLKSASTTQTVLKEIGLPGIRSIQVNITPPSYTGKKVRSQNSYTIIAEEGAFIEWILETDSVGIAPLIILNDSSNLTFQPINSLNTKWRAKLQLTQNALYQINWNQQLSVHFQLELIKDLVPVINIQKPKQYTVVDFGMPLKIPLQVSIKDDYGLVSTNLVLTVARGGGEAVQFNEQEVLLAKPIDHHQLNLAINHIINLQQLNMHPGDELYFYVKAMDNHQQETRSDIQIVNIADTAALMELDISINSLSLKPEFFRSQRQIIIETEQLLRDQGKISAEAFKEKSNELGVDQKLLRLRYGKFLGEESETNIGDSRFDDDGDHVEAQSVFGDAQSIIDGFSHKHDNAEDASFFDPKTKKELKAVLTEMWGSELKLRTYFPKEALPFEYKALRLLKELQQQSRAYVAKTNQKTTPLKFEKRLTGDLSKIVPPLLLQEKSKQENPSIVLRKSMGILVSLNNQLPVDLNEMATLKKALIQLNQQAIAKPSIYLLPFEGMKRILWALENKKAPILLDQQIVLSACEKLLTPPSAMPFKKQIATDAGLSDYYFHHLNNGQK